MSMMRLLSYCLPMCDKGRLNSQHVSGPEAKDLSLGRGLEAPLCGLHIMDPKQR